MDKYVTVVVRLDENDAELVKRLIAQKFGKNNSEIVRKGIRMMAETYHVNDNAEETDMSNMAVPNRLMTQYLEVKRMLGMD
jgi:Arc/MetJ-type ribon-helix-helix transcriptional regulator